MDGLKLNSNHHTLSSDLDNMLNKFTSFYQFYYKLIVS